jgi:hypothetical protein
LKKSDLLAALETGHEEILQLIEGIPEEELTRPNAVGAWSVKDVLSHLLIWEAETVKLLYMAESNRKPQTAHFKTISDDEQNAIWYEQFKDRPYMDVWNDFVTIRDQTIARVNRFSDSDLNNPGLFPWLKGKSLAQIIEEYILQHDAEHLEGLKAWQTSRNRLAYPPKASS